MLWRVEFRKHLPVFVAAYLATTVTGVAAVLAPDIVTLDVIRALCTLLCWSATTVYSAVVVFAFLVLGRDQLFQISTRSRWQLVGLKLGVLAVLLTVQHLLTVGLQLQSLLEPAGADAAAVIWYVTLAKVVSIAAFLLSVTFLATLSKVLRGRGVLTSFFAVGLLVIIGVQAVLLWRLGAPTTQEFFIGVGGQLFTVNLYANILPLTLTDPSAGFLPPISGLSVVLNLIAAIVSAAAWAVLAKVRRFDFLPM
ncbi:hypothetical protein [Curtobacterium sp. MCPF17_031]|uniref:hypothetical protein n=1 Tax=Curtobacterium sp. MCPF17_031 TaxID=2175653 RepID=UPI000DA78E37|nr:hypothetical protein [Curtobacterium sp. MCPF17_031]PZE36491.1 hypothetical protein DEJ31_08955 [Curtobacterium sp. MCPF17_031]